MKRRSAIIAIVLALAFLSGCAGGSGGSNMGGNTAVTTKVSLSDGTPAAGFIVAEESSGLSLTLDTAGQATFLVASDQNISFSFFTPDSQLIESGLALGPIENGVEQISVEFTISDGLDEVEPVDVSVELEAQDPIAEPAPKPKQDPREDEDSSGGYTEIENTITPGNTEAGAPTSSEYQEQGNDQPSEETAEAPQGMGIQQKVPSNSR